MSLSLLLNITLILRTVKKTSELSFCSRLKIYVLIISTLAFVFKIIFSAVKKAIFPQSRMFPSSRNFATVMESFLDQGIFPQTSFTWSRVFSTNKGIFQSRKLSSKRIYLIKEIFRSQETFSPKISTNKKFSTSLISVDQWSFPQRKIFTRSKKISAKKYHKDFLNAKFLDPFYSKSYAKIY